MGTIKTKERAPLAALEWGLSKLRKGAFGRFRMGTIETKERAPLTALEWGLSKLRNGRLWQV